MYLLFSFASIFKEKAGHEKSPENIITASLLVNRSHNLNTEDAQDRTAWWPLTFPSLGRQLLSNLAQNRE